MWAQVMIHRRESLEVYKEDAVGERRQRSRGSQHRYRKSRSEKRRIGAGQIVLLFGRSVDRWRRSVDRRPACMNVHRKEAVDRPVDRLTGPRSRLGPVDRCGRPWHGSVDRQARFDFPFRIRIPFLDGIESNLGFLKSRDSVAINKGQSPPVLYP